MFRNLFRYESGYSLVEVMVAIMILSLAIIPMVGMFDAGMQGAMSAGDYDRARVLANERLEKVRALPYNKPGSPADSAVELYTPGSPVTGTQSDFSYTVTTRYWTESAGVPQPADNSFVRPMMQITVTVTWGSGKSYTTSGFTAVGGI